MSTHPALVEGVDARAAVFMGAPFHHRYLAFAHQRDQYGIEPKIRCLLTQEGGKVLLASGAKGWLASSAGPWREGDIYNGASPNPNPNPNWKEISTTGRASTPVWSSRQAGWTPRSTMVNLGSS